MKWHEAVERFAFHCRYEKNLSGKTMRAYETDLRQFGLYMDELGLDPACDVLDVDKDVLRGWLQRLYDTYKTRSIKRKLATLKALFHFLEFEDVVESSPFRKIRVRLRQEKDLPKTVSLEVVEKLLAQVYGQQRVWAEQADRKNPGSRVLRQYAVAVRDVAIIELLFASGMRVAELCSLKACHVDLQEGSVLVQGKGRRERLIPVCAKGTLESLEEYQRTWNIVTHESTHYFMNTRQTRLRTQTVRAILKQHAQAANIPTTITPHMLRHTIATQLLENGVDLRNIQQMLGHASISTTEIYTRVTKSAQKRILEQRHPRHGMGGG